MVSVRLDSELEVALQQLAKRKGVPKSTIIKEALRQFLRRAQKEERLDELKRLSQRVSHVEGAQIEKLEDEMNRDLF